MADANILDLAALRQSLTRLRTKLNGKADSTALATKADKTTATTTADGLMSKEDKATLDSLANGSSSGGNSGNSGGTSGDGIYFTPHVASNGDLSWTNNGGLTNPTTVNIKGPTGPVGPAGQDGTNGRDGTDGQDGAPGQAATIEIGTVTAGSTPSVSNSGTATAAVLNFVLPQGSGSGGGGMTQEQVQAMINSAMAQNGLQQYIDVGGDNEVDAAVLRGIRQVIEDFTGTTLDVSNAGLPNLPTAMRAALSTIVGQEAAYQSVVEWDPSSYMDLKNVSLIALGQGTGPATRIGEHAFSRYDDYYGVGVRLDKCKTISIPNTVANIGEGAFFKLGLEAITIPASVTHVERDACKECASLEHAALLGGTYADEVFRDCISLEIVTAASGVVFSGNGIFRGNPRLESIQVPDSTTSIPDDFCKDDERLTSVTLHSGITSIGEGAFYGCKYLSASGFSFATLTGLEEIKQEAFKHCQALNHFLSGCTSLKYIRNSAFHDTKGVSSFTFPASLLSIGDNAFEECSDLGILTIGNRVQRIGDNAFKNCSALAQVVLNCTALTEMWHPFQDCDLLTSVGDTTGNGKIQLTWDNGAQVKVIPEEAFQGMSKLTSVTIPDGVTVIQDRAFQNCGELLSLSIPASVTRIKSQAFAGCSKLNTITLRSGASFGSMAIEGGAFDDVPASNKPSSNA